MKTLRCPLMSSEKRKSRDVISLARMVGSSPIGHVRNKLLSQLPNGASLSHSVLLCRSATVPPPTSTTSQSSPLSKTLKSVEISDQITGIFSRTGTFD